MEICFLGKSCFEALKEADGEVGSGEHTLSPGVLGINCTLAASKGWEGQQDCSALVPSYLTNLFPGDSGPLAGVLSNSQ